MLAQIVCLKCQRTITFASQAYISDRFLSRLPALSSQPFPNFSNKTNENFRQKYGQPNPLSNPLFLSILIATVPHPLASFQSYEVSPDKRGFPSSILNELLKALGKYHNATVGPPSLLDLKSRLLNSPHESGK